jgi:hypothetical protein
MAETSFYDSASEYDREIPGPEIPYYKLIEKPKVPGIRIPSKRSLSHSSRPSSKRSSRRSTISMPHSDASTTRGFLTDRKLRDKMPASVKSKTSSQRSTDSGWRPQEITPAKRKPQTSTVSRGTKKGKTPRGPPVEIALDPSYKTKKGSKADLIRRGFGTKIPGPELVSVTDLIKEKGKHPIKKYIGRIGHQFYWRLDAPDDIYADTTESDKTSSPKAEKVFKRPLSVTQFNKLHNYLKKQGKDVWDYVAPFEGERHLIVSKATPEILKVVGLKRGPPKPKPPSSHKSSSMGYEM